MAFSLALASGLTTMKRQGSIDQPDPWRIPVLVAQIPETGLHRDLEASATEREAMAATARMPPQRASRPRGGRMREHLWPVTIIPELVPSPCIAQGVDVPGSTPDCNKRLPKGPARGTHNALAVQSLQETPEPVARHH